MPPFNIPNDIFQHSLPQAVTLGPTDISPPVGRLVGYGTHGIGMFPDGTFLLLENSVPWSVGSSSVSGKSSSPETKFTATRADHQTQLPFVMVTVFIPSFSRPLGDIVDSKRLLGFFRSPGRDNVGGKNSLMPFQITGSFASLNLKVSSTQRELKDVKGTIFGFYGPDWISGASFSGLFCVFLGDDDASGVRTAGFVVDWNIKDATLEWAICGRFHLGLPMASIYSPRYMTPGL